MSQDMDQLLDGLVAGREEAFAAVYDLHGRKLYGYILGMVRNVAQAEDIVQGVMLRLVRHREKLATVKNLTAYLFVIARNEVLRFLERENRRTDVEMDAGEDRWLESHRPEEPGDDRTEVVRQALERLPVEQAEVISLKVFQGLTFAEIGEVLGVSHNTAASRYRYALDKLARYLESSHETR